jgi:RNA ligase (TIGR02306 family)
MERKLASIQKIVNIEAIPNADAIEVATVLGWKVVVKKGEFSIGEYCVYCEIDSVFPERDIFDFLKSKHYRIKTIRLRGQISQGICFPMSILPEGDYIEGEDVTEILNITKYDPPVPAQLRGVVKGNFPSFIPKTDEMRIQSYPHILDRHKGKRCYVGEKLNGTSMTVYLKDLEFGVCSRNLELKEEGGSTYWKIAREENLEELLKSEGRNLALQGELIGQGIQKNPYKLSNVVFKCFNVFDIDKFAFLPFDAFLEITTKLNISIVPILETDFELNHTIEELLLLSEGKSVLNPLKEKEGIVIRTIQEDRDIEIGRVSFKVINNKHLLEEAKHSFEETEKLGDENV